MNYLKIICKDRHIGIHPILVSCVLDFKAGIAFERVFRTVCSMGHVLVRDGGLR